MRVSLITSVVFAAASVIFSHAAAPWPAFRGPNGSGVAPAARPPDHFGPGTNLLWKVAVPTAPSSPCLGKDRIFLTAHAEGKLQTLCLDSATGKVLWIQDAPVDKLEDFHPTEGSPAASTPVTDGERVISYFGSFGVLAYDLSGKELWRHRLPVAETDGGFGTGASPMLAGKLVLLNRQQRAEPCLLALDARTGKKIWENRQVDAMTSYSTPMVWGKGGGAKVIVPGSSAVKGYSLKTGQEEWVLKPTAVAGCTTAVAGDGLLFYGGWGPVKGEFPGWAAMAEQNDKNKDGKIARDELDASSRSFFKAMDADRDGALTESDWKVMEEGLARGKNVLVALRPGGKGDISSSHVVWTFDRGLPYVPSPLYYQDRIYLVKDGGLVTCLEARTGKPVYIQERAAASGTYYASPVAADGRIFLVSGQGKITVLKAGAAGPEVLHQTDLEERTMATPALAGNTLYVRTATALYAFAKK